MKNLLLIDDEVNLLDSLREGLSSESALFNTHIAHSVDEAISLIRTHQFDLIITDIRMPEKSGLELLIFLREIAYSGEIMVMTAYGDEEISAHIKTLGGAKIIAKPFDYDWFKNMVVDFFSEKGFSGTIDSIDLTTLLQVIHMEKKTTGIEININSDKGFLFFKDGELINAEYKEYEGEEAAMRLISLNSGHFNVVKVKQNIKRKIKVPFMNFLIGIMKDVDELVENRKSDSGVREMVSLDNQILSVVKDIVGYKWSVFFNVNEDIVLRDIGNGFDEEPYVSMFSNILDSAAFVMQNEGHGGIELLMLNTENTVFIFSELKKNDVRMVLALDINGNLVKAKQIIRKLMNGIDNYIK